MKSISRAKMMAPLYAKNVRHRKIGEAQECALSKLALRSIAAQNPDLKLAFATARFNSERLRLTD